MKGACCLVISRVGHRTHRGNYATLHQVEIVLRPKSGIPISSARGCCAVYCKRSCPWLTRQWANQSRVALSTPYGAMLKQTYRSTSSWLWSWLHAKTSPGFTPDGTSCELYGPVSPCTVIAMLVLCNLRVVPVHMRFLAMHAPKQQWVPEHCGAESRGSGSTRTHIATTVLFVVPATPRHGSLTKQRPSVCTSDQMGPLVDLISTSAFSQSLWQAQISQTLPGIIRLADQTATKRNNRG